MYRPFKLLNIYVKLPDKYRQQPLFGLDHPQIAFLAYRHTLLFLQKVWLHQTNLSKQGWIVSVVMGALDIQSNHIPAKV